MSFPKVQELRSRLQTRMGAVRARVPTGGILGKGQMRLGQGQMRLGGGALVEQARQRANIAARRMAERKPGVIPMVKEFKPGERVREIIGQQGVFGQREITDTDVGRFGIGGDRDMSIAGARPAYPFDGRDMAVFVE